MLINGYIGGSCNGGNPAQVYKYANEKGLVHSSCEQYIGHNLESAFTPLDECKDCSWPPPAEGEDGQENCFAVQSARYYVSSYYKVKGADAMKQALQDGPISCGVSVTDNFLAYKPENFAGGIYSEHTGILQRINHEISVVGYSKDAETGDEYWIGRNSWGNYWGNFGFFYMKMHSDNLKIETDCLAGDVTYTKPNSAEVFTQ